MHLIFYPDGTGLYQTNPNYLILNGKKRGFKSDTENVFHKSKGGLVPSSLIFTFGKRSLKVNILLVKHKLRFLSFQVFKVLENINSQNIQEHLEHYFSSSLLNISQHTTT